MIPDYTIIKKGYEIDFSRMFNGFLCSQITCVANDKNQAKSILLQLASAEEITPLYYDDLNYFNIPVIRNEQYDLIAYNGQELPRHKVQEIIVKEERNRELDTLLNDPSVTHCYIKKRGQFYCDGYCGYTSFRLKAGIYLKSDAVSHARGVCEVYIVPVNIVEHNSYISGHIEDLKTRIIKL